MHIIVSWDVTAGADRNDIVDRLVAAIRPYNWVRPLTTFYIIQANAAEREVILHVLKEVSNRHPGRIELVVSPTMNGIYGGTLPQAMWDAINKITA